MQTWPHVVHWDALCYIVTPSLEASTGISSAKFTNLMLLSTHQMGKRVSPIKRCPPRDGQVLMRLCNELQDPPCQLATLGGNGGGVLALCRRGYDLQERA